MAERAPRIRRAALPADAVIAVRADDLIEDSSRIQAEKLRCRYRRLRTIGPLNTTSDPTGTMRTTDEEVGEVAPAVHVDSRIDLQTMDETGLPWTFLDEAADPSRIVPGAHVIAGFRCHSGRCRRRRRDRGRHRARLRRSRQRRRQRTHRRQANREHRSCIAASARSSARSGRNGRYGTGRHGTTAPRNPRKHRAEGHSAAPARTRHVQLITRRSRVQIPPPPPCEVRKPRPGAWAFAVDEGVLPGLGGVLPGVQPALACVGWVATSGAMSASMTRAASACMPGRTCW